MMIDALRDSVRPVITYLFSIALLWGFAVRLIDGAAFLGIASTVIMFWFAKQSIEKAMQHCPLGCAICNGVPPAPSPAAPTDSATVSLTLPTKGWRG